MSVSFLLVVFPVVVDGAGNSVDVEADGAARAELHRRVEELSHGTLVDCCLKAGVDMRDVRPLLHEAVDGVLGSYNSDLVRLRVDASREWIACGGWDVDLSESFDACQLLAVSGITESPLKGRDGYVFAFDCLASEVQELMRDVLTKVVDHVEPGLSASEVATLKRHVDDLVENTIPELARRAIRRGRAGTGTFDLADIDLQDAAGST